MCSGLPRLVETLCIPNSPSRSNHCRVFVTKTSCLFWWKCDGVLTAFIGKLVTLITLVKRGRCFSKLCLYLPGQRNFSHASPAPHLSSFTHWEASGLHLPNMCISVRKVMIFRTLSIDFLGGCWHVVMYKNNSNSMYNSAEHLLPFFPDLQGYLFFL